MARMVGAVGERLRSHQVLSWSAVGVAAAALVVACLVPSLEIAISAFIGAGNDQRGFRYERELALAFDVGWPGPLALVAGLALVVASVTGIVVGSRPWLVVGSFAVAVALGLLVFDTEDQRLSWAESRGVVAYESPHGGPLLQPALDELKAEARASPEARNPGWTLTGGEHGFSSRGLTAWRVFLWSVLAILWLTGYRLSRLALGPLASVSLVAAATAAFFVWLVVRTLTRFA
jgi:hypothetical protein